MPRQTRPRKVVEPPKFKGYKPYGIVEEENEVVELHYEEYEALKLADYDGMNHDKAANLMDISRPTFARIYDAARKKIAKAFVESKEIVTVYGNAQLDKSWHFCSSCHTRFTIPEAIEKKVCPMCQSAAIAPLS